MQYVVSSLGSVHCSSCVKHVAHRRLCKHPCPMPGEGSRGSLKHLLLRAFSRDAEASSTCVCSCESASLSRDVVSHGHGWTCTLPGVNETGSARCGVCMWLFRGNAKHHQLHHCRIDCSSVTSCLWALLEQALDPIPYGTHAQLEVNDAWC